MILKEEEEEEEETVALVERLREILNPWRSRAFLGARVLADGERIAKSQQPTISYDLRPIINATINLPRLQVLDCVLLLLIECFFASASGPAILCTGMSAERRFILSE